MEPKLIVGRNIRANRERIGISQEALAHRCGMHPVEVGRAERGLRDLRVSTGRIVGRASGVGVWAAEWGCCPNAYAGWALNQWESLSLSAS